MVVGWDRTDASLVVQLRTPGGIAITAGTGGHREFAGAQLDLPSRASTARR